MTHEERFAKAAVTTRPLLLALLLFACGPVPAQQQAGTDGTSPQPPSKDCLPADRLAGWEALDQRNLLLFAPSREEPYHVVLNRICTGVDGASRLGLGTENGWICSREGDEVATPLDRCRVLEVIRLAPDDVPALRERFSGSARKHSG